MGTSYTVNAADDDALEVVEDATDARAEDDEEDEEDEEDEDAEVEDCWVNTVESTPGRASGAGICSDRSRTVRVEGDYQPNAWPQGNANIFMTKMVRRKNHNSLSFFGHWNPTHVARDYPDAKK